MVISEENSVLYGTNFNLKQSIKNNFLLHFQLQLRLRWFYKQGVVSNLTAMKNGY